MNNRNVRRAQRFRNWRPARHVHVLHEGIRKRVLGPRCAQLGGRLGHGRRIGGDERAVCLLESRA